MENRSRFICLIFVLVSAVVLSTGKITRVSRSVAVSKILKTLTGRCLAKAYD